MRTRTLELTSAGEASARLGVSRASLYAYVSRGLIRSFSSPHDPRQRLYALDDVEALVERKARFRRPAAAAATALDWGLPVLQTALTQIRDGRLFYRDRDALTLAESATLEDVACLLIGGMDRSAFEISSSTPVPESGPAFGPDAFVRKAIHLLAGISGPATDDPSSEAVSILRLVTAATSDPPSGREPIHRRLASCWGVSAEAGEAIRRALVLCADHELSASAFAVRVAASTGAALRYAVIAGLAALSGPRHGGATEQVRAVLDAYEAPGGRDRLRAELAAGERVPGFHHPLYPEGDPRGTALVKDVPLLPLDAVVLEEVGRATGMPPALDMALVMAERAYGLPRGAAFALFAIGRTAGWLAHAVEQRSQGSLIRPRARYVVAEETPFP